MKKTNFLKKALSLLLAALLIAAMALLAVGCKDEKESPSSQDSVLTENNGENESANGENKAEVITIGEGSTEFSFTVTDTDGKTTEFKVLTDEKTVGKALLDTELIAGEDGDYGLYVKTVNGITLDYDTDGKYWAFYVNGEYGSKGVDSTEIKSGESYAFKAE